MATTRLGRGDGTFGFPVDVDRIDASAVAIGDVNRDGTVDIVATGLARTVVYLGNGDGTFLREPPLPPDDEAWSAISVADLDGDGVQDVAQVLNYPVTNTLGFRHGHGDGTFDPSALYGAGNGPTLLAIADVDGNGLADVLVVDAGDSSVSVMLDGCFR